MCGRWESCRRRSMGWSWAFSSRIWKKYTTVTVILPRDVPCIQICSGTITNYMYDPTHNYYLYINTLTMQFRCISRWHNRTQVVACFMGGWTVLNITCVSSLYLRDNNALGLGSLRKRRARVDQVYIKARMRACACVHGRRSVGGRGARPPTFQRGGTA